MSPRNATELRVVDVVKSFGKGGAVPVLKGVSVDIAASEFVVLLGPSGCGKTTLLRGVAGLESLDSGRIEIGGRVVVDADAGVYIAPQNRNLGMVFQNYALWPHMTVVANVAYTLRSRGYSKGQATEEATAMLQVLGCGTLASRYPSELSGGQQQRVALARSMVGNPTTILFDEPLSNLDAQLRRAVRSEIHRYQREFGFTGIYVTHDLQEALELGDRVAIMHNGLIEQIASPREIYEQPATRYVAEFFGIENHFTCSGSGSVAVEGFQIAGAWGEVVESPGRVDVYVRAQDIEVHEKGVRNRLPSDGCWLVGGRVVDVLYGGVRSQVVVDFGGRDVVARVSSQECPEIGSDVDCRFSPTAAFAYAAQ